MTPLKGKVRVLIIKAPEVLDQKEARIIRKGETNRVIEKIEALEVIGREEITMMITGVAIMRGVEGNRGMMIIAEEALIMDNLRGIIETRCQKAIEKVRDRSLIIKSRVRDNNLDSKLMPTYFKVNLLGSLI